jgi:hypothetical protein
MVKTRQQRKRRHCPGKMPRMQDVSDLMMMVLTALLRFANVMKVIHQKEAFEGRVIN